MAKKILVIDDDPYTVKYLETLFQDNGYETCSAANGVEGHEVVRAERPDLITLDLEMSQEWGTRFYRKLSKDSEFKDIPIIVISGMPSSHLAIKKVAAYFSKPFDPNEVLKKVREILGE
jgi:DNA-binding response OmpR family regulator